jgi:hypothetical protein
MMMADFGCCFRKSRKAERAKFSGAPQSQYSKLMLNVPICNKAINAFISAHTLSEHLQSVFRRSAGISDVLNSMTLMQACKEGERTGA